MRSSSGLFVTRLLRWVAAGDFSHQGLWRLEGVPSGSPAKVMHVLCRDKLLLETARAFAECRGQRRGL